MKKYTYVSLIIVLVLVLAYVAGPEPNTPRYPQALPGLPGNAVYLSRFITEKEHRHKLKPENEAEIIWAGPDHLPTDVAFVYLHGFSSSKTEGDPLHRKLATAFHANLFLARLAEQGIDTVDAMKNFTAENQWASAKEAYAIGRKLGKKVIIIGCSTGGTLALKLAATYPDIAGLILLSPNIRINNPTAFMLNNPWGKQIAEQVFGGETRVLSGKNPSYKKYWYTRYHANAVVQLEELVETTMTPETFGQVHQPVLSLFYYKDEDHQDDVVRVDKIHWMMDELATPDSLKTGKAIPNAGNHVLGSWVTSKDWKTPLLEAERFCRKKLHLK